MPEQVNSFEPFDPLKVKLTANTEAQVNALKREIENILKSYVGWFDPFSELIQNGIDSVEKRTEISEGNNYIPTLWITINIQDNYLCVTDNGIGLSENQFKQFLAPYFSFKSGNTRGRKGAGATYFAYGFNYIQICTKAEDYTAIGKMNGAKNWVEDHNPAGNPEVVVDHLPIDKQFEQIDKGVSICIKFDNKTAPKDLSWIQVKDAKSWLSILRIKTAIGAIYPNKNIKIIVKVIDKNGESTNVETQGIDYLWTHEITDKFASLRKIKEIKDKVYQKNGNLDRLPSQIQNLEVIYETWHTQELIETLKLQDEEELEICNKYKPFVYCGYVYSTKQWDSFNQKLNLRAKQKMLYDRNGSYSS